MKAVVSEAYIQIDANASADYQQLQFVRFAQPDESNSGQNAGAPQ